MKTISFINLKGGVGKTTISTWLAYLLAESWDLRVLFIDNDKQGNASRWLGADERKGTLTNILMDGASARDVLQKSQYTNIDFIAADMGLVEANYAVIGDQETRQDLILKNALAEIADDYAVCVIDNPPDINMSVFNALSCTDDVIIVTLLELDSIEGIRKMRDQITDVQQFNPGLSIKGVLVNQYMAYPEAIELSKDLEREGFPLFQSRVSYATPMAKRHILAASRARKSIFEVCPYCRMARDVLRFAEELLQ
ncbi:MAG: ParA family protein [Selenomonas massiliensis]